MSFVVVIDCGIGNVQSVVNACQRVGGEVCIVQNGDELNRIEISHLILPGVGAIGEVMANLHQRGLIDSMARRVFDEKIPFLGICVGMQILGEAGEEFGGSQTLGWIPGVVRSLARENEIVRLPHVGWNTVEVKGEDPLFVGIRDAHFYFVHSFALECPDDFVIAYTTYHRPFVSAVRKGNIVGTQFHPEKSSGAGEILLKNFLDA